MRQKRNAERVRRLILADRSTPERLFWAVLAVALPAAFRWSLDRGESGFPFVTFFPSVVLTAVLLDWQFAVIVVIGAALFCVFGFRGDTFAHLPLHSRMVIAVLYFTATGLLVFLGKAFRTALREMAAVYRHQEIVAEETRHRMKNLLAVVNAIAMQTARTSDPEHFCDILSGRLGALSKAVDIEGPDQAACDIAEIVTSAVAPFQSDGRIHIVGPKVMIQARVATTLLLALHELSTNALKYGALSDIDGGIDITWESIEGGDAIVLSWREHGGPKVTIPTHFGFGTKLLETQSSLIQIRREFEAEGVRCEIRLLATP